ncbi:N-acetylmuramic acid 6-phosphate etherase [Mesorhizobium sp. M4B.F.Ca.ET.190.01.1.1]|uniref:N-acetylmuramic acid 6-phosphate etherase n=1 Tax=Mesorhizobium abyssinicae TaxID=1209958 RepID=A0ABU5AH78_9HYPH|nr:MULTISPECIES: N-acetylmuramic acid 6-phosphate etherase [Mesorhizobium]MDX8536625.1 N-acetylmuramic acid 6-phosphate etherase [Mesorhizobium abyssinicae]RWA59665.1 MAG: N-acetylmuramic acid 6-phosphate etherase [Mesorhizobium sp.]RWF62178.1 MAG: N-acetylmuramic acid 6-phosphate etherase [Mesorhizobium sp.]TGR09121.1 N-acetylmuramic acid 6-phosphate etherase [Mesorhizobium sp. M4B.F.Ca.ET.200.01.1.1]TGS18600.1 N-acetylmuramic acid 6-phosphate etherase [Mesorhizobium sp. M4B.F.Ca.ET.190.01.1.
MAEKRTEAHHQNAEGLDIQAPDAILSFLADAQIEAAKAVRGAIPAIAAASEIVAERLKDGGRLAYAAAGSSGLMALADALELPGTFGIGRDRIAILIAGGDEAFRTLAGGPEDDTDEASAAVAAAGIGERDCLIAISASGSTPYAVAALEHARSRGAATIAIANNRDVPLFRSADVAIVLETPPELIAGSTRMGAGTAQKIALNMLSTLAAIHLGHVHDGYMVNLTADNIKLRDRAIRIVAAISGRGRDDAARLLEQSGGVVKTAILLAAGAANADTAEKILEGTGRKLRPALSAIEGSKGR